jgi:8-oxo-dGTP pyrophosphatase MutT (NUDIX family)
VPDAVQAFTVGRRCHSQLGLAHRGHVRHAVRTELHALCCHPWLGSSGTHEQNTMPRRKHVAKALTYITRDEHLLVFRQPDFPAKGIQVPGGSVERGEALEAAALREAHEETGLGGLIVQSYLGSVEYDLKVDVGPPHLRHFFHLSYSGPTLERWLHVELKPSTVAPPVRLEFWWEPLATVHIDWEMDHYLEALKQKLERVRKVT